MYHLHFWFSYEKVAFHWPSIHNPIYPQSFLAQIYKTGLYHVYILSLFFSHPQDAHHIILSLLSSSHQNNIHIYDLKISLCINLSFSLRNNTNFWLEFCPLHPTPLYRPTCTSDLSIGLCIQRFFTDTLALLTWVLPSTFLKHLFTPFKFLTWVFPPASNPSLYCLHFCPTYIQPSLHHLHFWLKYCTSHPTPIHTIYIFDLSIALYIQPPFLNYFIISDLSIGLYIQPLFTLLSFLFSVLPSAPNTSLHHLHFWLEYCPLNIQPFFTSLTIWTWVLPSDIQPLFITLTFLTRVLPSVSGILGMRMGRTSSLNSVRSEYSSTIVLRAFPEIHLADRALSC